MIVHSWLSGRGILRPLFIILIIGFCADALAEGRCPPGQYPIGDSRAPGCAPIPGGEGSVNSDPKPSGRWIKTWGAIAMSGGTGDVGAALGKRTKSEAEKAAIVSCSNDGARDCKVSYTYKNQCVSLVSPASSSESSTVGRGGSVEKATEMAMKVCTERGSSGCKVLYSACTDPIFESF